MPLRLGPAGLGPVKEALSNLVEYNNLGLRACEIAFTYGIYIKNQEDIKEINTKAKKGDIKLSIHAPYWINLNSTDKRKILQSKQRILNCCEIGERIGAYRIIFHPGYYGKMPEDQTYNNIREMILEMQEVIKKNNWKIKLAPETTGKINVFGSFKQISNLVEDTGCEFCIDFAHVLARDKKVDYEEIIKLFKKHKEWHCHFSGIEYGEKGERRHIKTSPENWKKLFKEIKELSKENDITIINESPYPVEDSVEGLRILKEIN